MFILGWAVLLTIVLLLYRLCEIRRGETPELHDIASAEGDFVPSSEDSPRKPKLSHCSFCGHPGSKRAHLKSRCQYCSDGGGEGCKQKAPGFKCSCLSCDTVHLNFFCAVGWGQLLIRLLLSSACLF